ncbi:P-loop containing nucleoside triphosphate hydrolase [Pseudocohnilembus persalinus]|uniref:Kinesin-like protein n=1 Tax=Pseudocohnilembus persalinus TaxID=266149 RepID=A0A0V0QH74_PSEPJ|nr:P-loop containing nucleoside triphosphate hydrolase [Pseudocohnilembus persalinus]|eukprot:KRX01515.1 P-loop containing nucleoside triphosphate hydrolase [Pseudocohnilembus persalinus]
MKVYCRDIMDFNFTQVLSEDVSQEQVFNKVAKPVVDNCMQGFNGTVFAYGQTGSGKTYTMNGSETWQDRGIIPRTISYIYDQIEARQDDIEFNLYISFMEIYNENAYDLLDHRHLDSPLESWNKINLMEDDFGNIHLKNVSVHSCSEEQQCIDLLMMGSFIRQVSSTPMNQSSSRSHAVFTITFEGKQKNSEMQFISKLHLVDLAGSERIQKSNIDGQLVNEAKYINLSLTYLEQVILALNDKQKNGQRQHIPYRNSLMTTILKDSLGGNCQTVMVATASAELQNYEETISTLRFSQRVGQLENEFNALIDGKPVFYTTNNQNNSINDENIQMDFSGIPEQNRKKLQKYVENFLNEKETDIPIQNLQESKLCFHLMKNIYNIRMKEYVTELTYISEKLYSYDELLSQKQVVIADEQSKLHQLDQQNHNQNNGINNSSQYDQLNKDNEKYQKAIQQIEKMAEQKKGKIVPSKGKYLYLYQDDIKK